MTRAIFAIQYLLESACRNLQSEILLRLQNIQHEFFGHLPRFLYTNAFMAHRTYIDRSGRNALLDTEHALLQFIAETLLVLQGSLQIVSPGITSHNYASRRKPSATAEAV